MAHQVEPMDVDSSMCDDNKENAFQHGNVLPRTPCTEKGYEELDVSELNMKLRYSTTPSSSPMSKSFTGAVDNKTFDCGDICNNDSGNMTRSLHSTLTKNETKSPKALPLQAISADQFTEGSRNVLRPLDSTVTFDNNIAVTISTPNETDENVSLPSTSSSQAHTPEATTPTKDLPKDGASPIMRGLKSVLNMFRSSQSPIPPEGENAVPPDVLSPPIVCSPSTGDSQQTALISTPLAARRTADMLTKRNSPPKESIVFNEDLEKELLWKDESTIIFEEEKVPIHKLFFQNTKPDNTPKQVVINTDLSNKPSASAMDSMVEYMDVSYNSEFDKTQHADKSEVNVESDSEFVDCETTFTKNESLFSAETSLEYVDPNLDSTKDIVDKLSAISGNDTTNASIETLELSSKSADVSNSSIVTMKVESTSFNIANEINCQDSENPTSNEVIPDATDLQNGANSNDSTANEEEELKAKNSILAEEPSLDDVKPAEDIIANNAQVSHILDDTNNGSPIISRPDRNISKIPDLHKPITEHALEHIPKLDGENTVVNSLSQIPLIADPRVLLFNISSEMPVEEVNVQNIDLESHLSPADVPLPDDGEMSLPLLINNTFEGTSQPSIENSNISDTVTTTTELIAAETKQDMIVVSSDSGDDKIANPQLVTDINEDSHTPIETKQTDLTYGLQAVAQMGIAPIIQNVIEPEIDSIEQTTSNEIITEKNTIDQNTMNKTATLSEMKQVIITDFASNIKIADISQKEINDDHNEESTTKDLDIPSQIIEQTETTPKTLVDIKPDVKEPVKGDATVGTLTPGHTVTHDSVSTLEDESKPLTIDIPQSPRPENFVAPVSDLVIEGAVQETPSNCVVQQDSPRETTVQAIILKTIPASDFAKLNNSLENRKSQEMKDPSVLSPTLPVFVKKVIQKPANDVQLTSDDVDAEIEKISNDNNILTQSKQRVEPVINVDTQDVIFKNTDNASAVQINNTEPDALAVLETELKPVTDCSATEQEKQTEINDIIESITTKEENTEQFVINDNEVCDVTMVDLSFSRTGETIDAPITTQFCDNQEANADVQPALLSSNVSEIVDSLQTEGTVTNRENNGKEIIENEQKVEKSSENNVSQLAISDNQDCDVTMVDLSSSKIVETLDVPITIQILEKPEVNKEDKPAMLSPNFSEAWSGSKKQIDEEIVASANNSPFVLVPTDVKEQVGQEKVQVNLSEQNPIESFEEQEISTAPKTENLKTPPGSPAIVSKGLYNFNFDDIDDPFATKTKIRQSPPPATLPDDISDQIDDYVLVQNNFPIKDKNRRKSQPEKKKSIKTQKIMNSTLETSSVDDMKNFEEKSDSLDFKTSGNKAQSPNLNRTPKGLTQNKEILEKSVPTLTKNRVISDEPTINKLKSEVENDESHLPLEATLVSSDNEHASSSEKSTYFATGISCSDSALKNVIGGPEIDDPDFNPFATKTRIQTSPPPGLGEKCHKVTSSPTQAALGKVDLTLNTDSEKPLSPIPGESSPDKDSSDTSSHNGNVTCLSKASTVQTVNSVNTEDADTIEGPFLDEEDLKDVDKMSDFDGENVDVFELADIPPENDENAEGEMFIDAEAFEFLLNQNKTNIVTDSGKESLFLKFDPLFAKRASTVGISAALNNFQKRQATPKKLEKSTPKKSVVATPRSKSALLATPQKETSPVSAPQKDATFVAKARQDATFDATSSLAEASELNQTNAEANTTAEESSEELNITVAKPMMVVNPAVNPVMTPRVKATTPNRRSLTFTSPAIAVIDKLLSISANNSMLGHDSPIRESRENNEANQALTELRELLADKEINVQNLRTESIELRERLGNLESQMKNLEAISQERLKKIHELNEKLNEKTKMNKSMANVVEEYERTIASLITETEQDKKRHAEERAQLISEREEATSHLASMEVSFSDLHSKYEKSKQVIFGFKANEESLLKSVKDFEENLTKMQTNYETLKLHATAKLNHANEELQKMNRAHEAEVMKLNAMIKRKEVDITSLEETLAQKTKTNQELAGICDSLLAKFG